MKTIRFYFYLFLFGSVQSLFAQEESKIGMLFPQFENGIVFFKNGVRGAVPLNYDMLMQEMLFLEKDSTVMKIDSPLMNVTCK